MPMFKPATVMVCHESAVIEAGIRHILGAWPEFEVLPAAHSNPRSALAAEPDLMVLDQERGIQWAKSRRDFPDSRANVMVVAMKGQESDVRLALEAGVRAYVLMGCSSDEIVDAAGAAAAGRRHLCSAASLHMADSLAQPALTPRESDVLALVFRGLNNKEVARALVISVGTVKSHMRGLMAKLGARCRTEALWIASQRGLITRPVDAVPGDSGSSRPYRTTGQPASSPHLGRTQVVRDPRFMPSAAQASMQA
jgi:DNA-binding NarL/FixJ family response regulator